MALKLPLVQLDNKNVGGHSVKPPDFELAEIITKLAYYADIEVRSRNPHQYRPDNLTLAGFTPAKPLYLNCVDMGRC